ncbi:MAG TPA: TetR/AcrR family transcriptional regulator [Acidimicrobiales bacterium]|jgi:AcrR family transcriptional regulator|nr:TetR/AcrR family transcriptional regulator [Acidimicrobiales bacterium]
MTVVDLTASGTLAGPRPSSTPSPSTGTTTTTPERRIVDAALRCICRWGVAKTALDDVAREAGCSRATVYRLFPGGKDGLMETVARTEIERFFAALADRLDTAATLEDGIVGVMAEAGHRLKTHEALQYLLAHEPEAVLPRLAFSEMDQVLRIASDFAAPRLSRWLPDDEARRAAEWVARLIVSYSITPATHMSIDDEGSVRALVRTFVLPGLTNLTNNANANASATRAANEGGTTNGQDH